MPSIGNTSDLQTQQALQQLLRGLNNMQAQQGLTAGGIPIPPPNMTALQMQPMYRPLHPSEFSTQIRVQHASIQQQHQMPLPMPVGSMTPVSQGGGMFMPGMPSAMYGGMGMAHQSAVQNANMGMAGMQAGAGLGMRAFGSMMAGGVGGLAGMTAYEHFGGGQRMQNFGSALFNPMIQQRAQALQLQRMSMGFVHGGSDMGASGMGLSMTASQRLNSGLSGMASSRQFQHETGGMFNRQDVMKITGLAGQFGMLDQSQSADQIKNQVGRISRALSGFMRIAEQPDLQEAMRMMGQMRNMGMSMPETSQAARNARMFARMAGTDTQAVMAQGMQGAGMFQQAGLSGASGMNAGMAAAGMSASMAGLMDPRRLAMAGGAGGIAQTMMGGAAQMGISDPVMASLLTRRGGHLAIDREALGRLTQGGMSIQDITQQGAQRISHLGGREALMELSTRRRELQDQAQGMMGGTISTLMPLILARSIQRGTPGMSMGGALRTLGMGEEQARTYEQMSQSPQFMENMRRQQRMELAEQRHAIAQTREETASAAGYGGFSRAARRHADSLGDRFDNFAETASEHLSGMGQDTDEEISAAGGGRVLRAGRGRDFGTESGRRALRRRLRSRGGVDSFYRQLSGMQAATQTGIDNENNAGSIMEPADAYIRMATGMTVGPGGLNAPGISGPRGEFLRETVTHNEDTATRIMRGTGLAALTGQSPSSAQVEARASEMTRTGQLFEARQHSSQREQSRVARGATTAIQRGMGGGGADRAQAAIGAASAAVNEMLASRVTHLGPFGADVSRPDEGEIQNTIRQALVSSGMSESEAARLSTDRTVMQQVVSAGSGSRSPEAQAAADAAVQAGGEVGAARAGRTASQMQQQGRAESTATLERLGISTGMFSHTGATAQRAVLSVMAGEGEGSQASRTLLAIRALETAGAGGDREAAARAAEMRTQFMGLSESERTSAEDIVSQAEGQMTSNDLLDMAHSFRGASSADISRTLETTHGAAMHAQSATSGAAMVETMGQEAYDAAGQGSQALIALAQGGGHIGGASDEDIEAMRGGGARGRAAAERYRRRMANQGAAATGAGGLTTSGGAAQSDDSGALSAILGDLAEGAGTDMGGGDEATGEEAGGASGFVHAVGIFGRASQNLLEASENIQQAAELGNLAGVAGGSDGPGLLANLLFPQLGGPGR